MNSKSLVESKPLLQVSNLNKHFPVRSSFGRTKGQVKAVNGVSFDIHTRQTFGLVGESGCGKSTLGRSILRLVEPTSGEALYEGIDILGLSKKNCDITDNICRWSSKTRIRRWTLVNVWDIRLKNRY